MRATLLSHSLMFAVQRHQSPTISLIFNLFVLDTAINRQLQQHPKCVAAILGAVEAAY